MVRPTKVRGNLYKIHERYLLIGNTNNVRYDR
jgi:hypothetical protein